MKDIIAEIVKDGIVDAQEARMLRTAIYADGTVDKEEADAMFELNDAVTGNENSAEYQKLFVDVISAYVLEDEKTPGVIDSAEGDYLVEMIGADGQVDEVEEMLLLNLVTKATEIQSQKLNDLIAIAV